MKFDDPKRLYESIYITAKKNGPGESLTMYGIDPQK